MRVMETFLAEVLNRQTSQFEDIAGTKVQCLLIGLRTYEHNSNWCDVWIYDENIYEVILRGLISCSKR